MCDFGGMDIMSTDNVFQTPMNTLGIGDPVPYGINGYGSGDLFGNKKGSKKSKKSNIATKRVPQCQLGVNLEQRPLIVMAK